MKSDSIFTKIIKGEIPSHKVYEDENNIAFIPLHPTALAHVLVVPKLQIEQFYQLPEENYLSLMRAVKKVANRVDEVYKPFRVGLKIEGLDIDHAHVHVLAYDNHEQYTEVEDMNKEIDSLKLEEMAKRLAF